MRCRDCRPNRTLDRFLALVALVILAWVVFLAK